MFVPAQIMQAQADKLLTDAQVAEMIGVSVNTLSTWRCRNTYGLPFLKIGRRVRYKRSDVLAWLETRTRGVQ